MTSIYSGVLPILPAEVAPSLMHTLPTTGRFTVLCRVPMSTFTVAPISSQVIATLDGSISSMWTLVLAVAPVFLWASVIVCLTILVPGEEG
jgi:hypothetical protein